MSKQSLFDLFATSENEAEDGKWFKFGTTMEIKIRRYKSKKAKKVREALEAPYKGAKFGAKIPQEILDEITDQHIATGIIADWKGVPDEQGNDIPFSHAASLAMIKALPEFRDAVAELSVDLDNFRQEGKEAIEGN